MEAGLLLPPHVMQATYYLRIQEAGGVGGWGVVITSMRISMNQLSSIWFMTLGIHLLWKFKAANDDMLHIFALYSVPSYMRSHAESTRFQMLLRTHFHRVTG